MAHNEASNQYFNALISKLTLGVITVDLEGKILMINPQACLILGIAYHRSEYIGQTLRTIFRHGLVHDYVSLLLIGQMRLLRR